MSGSSTLGGVGISSLPLGPNRLSAGMQIPIDDPNGGGAGVLETVRRPGSDFMATSVSWSGTVLGTVTLNPASFSYAGGTISVLSSGAGLTVGGVAVQTADPTLFTATGGVLGLLTTQESTLATAGSLTGAMQFIVFDNGVGKLATLSQVALETAILTEPAINLSSIGSQATGQPFQVTAILANYLAAPILSYADDGGVLGPLPAGATVSSSSVTLTHPGLPTGTHTLVLEDADGHLAVSASFAVAPVPITAAPLSNVPANGLQGQPISGVTAALTPAYATGYAVLNVNGADEGARQAFTGTAVPALTPAGPGNYAMVVYAALTGGPAIFTSAAIAVAAVIATGATAPANVPAAGQVGIAISGVTTALTPANATAYAVLSVGGVDQGQRVAFSGTALPAISPTVAGQTVFRVYAGATGGAALSTSAAFPVTVLATAATIAGAPASGTQGQPIGGLTDTLTPANATGYAVLYVNGADEGARQAFTGTAVPVLTPQGGGNYLAKLYAALTGGSALASSAVIPVVVPATAANLAGVPATGSVGTQISGITLSLTPSTASAFAALTSGGVEQGARLAVSAGALPSYTPTVAGSDTLEIFAAAVGGTPLFTSATIAIGAATAPRVGGASAVAILDASAAISVTADAAGNTPQGTNGGIVSGWKDATGNGNNFNQTTAGNAASLVTASQNNHPGILFSAAASATLNGLAAFAAALANAQKVGGTGLTIALTFKYNAVPSGYGQTLLKFNSLPSQIYFQVALDRIAFSDANANSPGNEALSVVPPAAGTLIKLIAVLDPNTFLAGSGGVAGTGTKSLSVNAIATLVSSYTQASDSFDSVAFGGGTQTSPDYTLYEIDVWQTAASGTGGASPTGDIAAILNYLTTKWGS